MAASVPRPTITVRMNPEIGMVNLPTWFWAEGYRGQDLYATRTWPSPPFVPTMITVRYSVRHYIWNFGDAGLLTTRSLGQPYPTESDIQNAYAWSSERREPGGLFRGALIVVWKVEYSANGGPYTALPDATMRVEWSHQVRELQPVVIR